MNISFNRLKRASSKSESDFPLSIFFRACALLASCALLAACAQTSQAPKSPPLDTVGSVILNQATEAPERVRLLEIGVLIFTADSDEQEIFAFGDWIFEEIHQKEAQLLPHLLRDTLVASNQWGAVRVIPEQDPSLDISITGEIIQSDGQNLELRIVAQDSTGREWLNKVYFDTATVDDHVEVTRFSARNRFDAINFIDPFQDIYNRIVNDLLAVRASLNDQSLISIDRVSLMSYAIDLSPESFAHMLVRGEDGLLTVSSLPANDDPMFSRVADMQYRHHLFIDTVDGYYQTLFDEVQPAYVLWRRYSIDQIAETESARQQAKEYNFGNSRSFLSLTQRYDRYKWSKIYEQEFTELAAGFNNELAPAMLELNSQVHGLNGTMEQQYRQWRGILRSLFELETAQLGRN